MEAGRPSGERFRALNQLSAYIDLYKIVAAGDAAQFDAKLHLALASEADPRFGERMALGLDPDTLDRSLPAEQWPRYTAYPRTFRMLRDMAERVGKEEFCHGMLTGIAPLPRGRDTFGLDLRTVAAGEPFAHHLELGELFDTGLLAEISSQLDHMVFVRRADKDIAVEHNVTPNPVVCLLNDLLSREPVTEAVETATGCPGELSHFFGRLFRLDAGGTYDSWHDDLVPKERRLLGLRVNLNRESYEGGALELRDRDTKRPLARIANAHFGHALLFKVAEDLEHRVTAVTSGTRTAFAGWFRGSQPWPRRGLWSRVKRRLVGN